MNALQRMVVELTGRRYESRGRTIWALAWRVVAAVVALAIIWLGLVIVFLNE